MASRCRRSAARFFDPRISVGVASPMLRRARTSTDTSRPASSRAKISISSPPTRRLRARISQPAFASASTASRSAAAPIAAGSRFTGRGCTSVRIGTVSLGNSPSLAGDLFGNWCVRTPMMWRHTELTECGEMGWSWVAGIGVPSIPWVPLVELSHQSIAKHLCHNGRAGD